MLGALHAAMRAESDAIAAIQTGMAAHGKLCSEDSMAAIFTMFRQPQHQQAMLLLIVQSLPTDADACARGLWTIGSAEHYATTVRSRPCSK
jgi:hypothetical protein